MAAISHHDCTCNQWDNMPDHWIMNKSEAGFPSYSAFVFYSLHLHNSIQKTDPVWWPSGELLRRCERASVHTMTVHENRGPQQVASSASITATHVTVYLSASCGLWACAQQSRQTVIPSGMTNYFSCLILACNSWMWTAALIKKNFHQQATHLCYEIGQAFSRYSILEFPEFQPAFCCKKIPNVSQVHAVHTFVMLAFFSKNDFKTNLLQFQ